MRKPVLIAAILSLTTTAVLADMYQDAKNAELPAARQNLELGTVKSEGGAPPNIDAVTRFYTPTPAGTTMGTAVQFEIASSPSSNEYAIEQAGLGAPGGVGAGQGATRICTAPYSNNRVDCNYVATGRDGRHLFGSGAGAIAEFTYAGTGAPNYGWLKFSSLENDNTRIETASNVYPNIDLEIKEKGYGGLTLSNGQGINLVVSSGTTGANNAWMSILGNEDSRVRLMTAGTASSSDLWIEPKGFGITIFKNGQGTAASIGSGTAGPTTGWPVLLSGNDANARFQAGGTATNVQTDLFAKGNAGVFLGNGSGSTAQFLTSSNPTGGYFVFTASGGVPTIGNSAGAGVQIPGQRVLVRQTINTTYTVPVSESSYHYHNTGASGLTTFNLPAAAQGLNYCFAVKVAQSVVIKAAAGDKIAVAGTNSAAAGQISSSAPFASVCIEAHEAGQWITIATPDKTQWTVT